MTDKSTVGAARLKYDHGIYTTLVIGGEPRDYFVTQCFSPQSLRRQLRKMRVANRSRVYWSTDPEIQ